MSLISKASILASMRLVAPSLFQLLAAISVLSKFTARQRLADVSRLPGLWDIFPGGGCMRCCKVGRLPDMGQALTTIAGHKPPYRSGSLRTKVELNQGNPRRYAALPRLIRRILCGDTC